MEPMSMLKHTRLSEKAMSNVEAKNELVFIVDRRATKAQIKEAVEKKFEVKVRGVNTLIDKKGRKKAVVRLKPESKALDIATRLGMI